MSERSGVRADGSRARRAVRGSKPRAHVEAAAAAAQLGGTESTVASLVRSGVLHPVEVDGRQVFLQEDVERLIAQWGVRTLPLEEEPEDEFEQYLEPVGGAAGPTEPEAPGQTEPTEPGQGNAEQ